MRSIEFFTYLLPSKDDRGELRPSRSKMTRWQAVGFPGARCIEDSREVRLCPESPSERAQLGMPSFDETEAAARQ